MQSFKILIDSSFSATTVTLPPVTNGVFVGNNFVHPIGIGGGLTDASNVYAYLNDANNLQIVNDFNAYLSGYSTPAQYSNIINNPKKLSDNFNFYYNTYVTSGSSVIDVSFINSSTSASTLTEGYDVVFNWDGDAVSNMIALSGTPLNITGSSLTSVRFLFLQDVPEESQNYYIPVFIKASKNDIPWGFVPCAPDIDQNTAFLYPQYSAITSSYFTAQNPKFYSISSAKTAPDYSFTNVVATNNAVPFAVNAHMSNLPLANLNTTLLSAATINLDETDTNIHNLIQCYVDLNLQTDENQTWSYAPLGVSFAASNYAFKSGKSFNINFSLSSPSVLGIEQCTIDLTETSNTPINLSQAFSSYPVFPATFAFSAGQQTIALQFVGNPAYTETGSTDFQLEITSMVNLNAGATVVTDVTIVP